MFGFASDTHVLEYAGDVGYPVLVSKFIGIPSQKKFHAGDSRNRHS
ncbi:MAG TPA: hypothetical protein VKM55_03625 [Candidatus Lokiarchaeia archaeon]|nr:hypothetical protein [Candidatus Lokiarchaeia archaeon]